jgi:Ca-activated chloride channel family protein
MYFQDPLLLVIGLAVLLAAFFLQKRAHTPGLFYSTVKLFPRGQKSWRLVLSRNLFVLRYVALLLCVIAIARPQAPLEESKLETEGIDIVLAVDLSGSMLAEDFTLKNKRVNRLAAVREVVKDFIAGRSNDRIGIVAFASRAYTVCPLTLDYAWVIENVDRLEIGMIEDGTAIGMGLSASLNRLKDSVAKSKVVVLLTDGRNNTGQISPQIASEAANALGVKVYTIGAGTRGMAPFPMRDPFGNTIYQPQPVDIDEETLQTIAQVTGGLYFRATDTKSLKNIYDEIDRLEKTTLEEKGYLEYRELFPWFVLPALMLIMLELILAHTVLRQLP